MGRAIRQALSVLGLMWVCLPTSAWAASFSAGIDQAQWELKSSKFECLLSQKIPQFGEAVFEKKAGERMGFLLHSSQPSLLGRETRVTAEAPAWLPGSAPRELGVIEGRQRSGTLFVGERLAKDMLVSLYEGKTPTFSNNRWHGSDQPVKVMVSAVNFQAAYNDYVNCMADLLPVNFRQIARSAVLFPSAQWQLSEAAKRRLDLIVLYVKTDPGVQAIFIDGHSDNVGRRLANRDLSRQRADAVTEYLIKAGLGEEMITTRYHGERYPVVKNSNQSNRARNRRVTIRLERE